MKKLLILLLTSISLSVFAKEDKKPISFAGGAHYAFGYMDFNTDHGNMACFSNGVGGRLYLNLCNDHLRVGGMGAACNLNYDDLHSSGRLAFGGVSADYVFIIKRVKLALGCLVGGGGFKDYYFYKKEGSDDTFAKYSKKGTFIVSPMVNVDVSVTKALGFIFTVEYPIGNFGTQHTLTYPQMKLGVLFTRMISSKK